MLARDRLGIRIYPEAVRYIATFAIGRRPARTAAEGGSMLQAPPPAPATLDDDDIRLESLGYRPQLNRVLGLFAN